MNAKSIASIFGLGIVQIGLAAVFFSFAIKRISAIQSSLIAVIEPALNPLWVFLAIGEKPTGLAIVGGGIIIAAVVVSSVISVSRDARISDKEAAV